MLEQKGPFLALPRELRDKIYGCYLIVEGGYVFNPITDRLVAANNKPIDLALVYTCKLVALEMHNLGLKLNTINFSTVFSPEKRSTIGRFQHLRESYAAHELHLLKHAGPCINEDVFSHVEKVYPQFMPVIRIIQGGNIWPFDTINKTWGWVPSVFRRFVSEILQIVSRHPRFDDTMSQAWKRSFPIPNLIRFLSFSQKDLRFPTETLINAMRSTTGLGYFEPSRGVKYRTSATNSAVLFLATLSPGALSSLRKIVLHEDHESTCWPESHAQNLIPVCRNNPDLRVEQRVDLWRNVWPASAGPVTEIMGLSRTQLERERLDFMPSDNITRSHLAPWIMETLTLPSLGMPPQSFHLVLDGGPDPKLTTDAFEIVQRDASWQRAFEEHGAEHKVIQRSSESQYMMLKKSFILYGFPQAMHDITEKSSPMISCNFDIGPSWDIAPLQERSRAWSWYDWEEYWHDHQPKGFEPELPLPDWIDIRREAILLEDGFIENDW